MARVPDSIRARFSDEAVATLHRISGGVPRRVNALAADLMRGIPSQVAAAHLNGPSAELRVTPSQPEPSDGEAEPGGSEERAGGVEPGEEVQAVEEAPPPAAEPRRRFLEPARRTALVAALVVVAVVVAVLLVRPRPEVPPPSVDAAPPASAEAGPRTGAKGSPPARVVAPARTVPDAPASRESERPGVGSAPEAAGPSPVTLVQVQVNATPWASIEIDGTDFGETPLAGISLPRGAHTFRARMPDGRVVERVVEVDDDSRFVVFE
jgi:hypothetical protein